MRLSQAPLNILSILLLIVLASTSWSQTIPTPAKTSELKALTFRNDFGSSTGFSSKPNNSARSRPNFILTQIWDDLTYLVNQQDFYLIVGGISLAPNLVGTPFRDESAEFTELWGASKFADNFFEAGEIAGHAGFPIVTSIATYSLGYLNDSNRLKRFGSDLFRAHTINGLFTLGIKLGVGRSRPDGGPYSYPSGHTSTAFVTSAVLHKHFGQYVGVPAFVIASYIGLSRLQENRHYLSDVVGGAILGTYIGMKIANQKNGDRLLRLSPTMIQGSPGAKISIRF